MNSLPALPAQWLILQNKNLPESLPTAVLVDPVEPYAGELLEEVELLLHEVRRRAPDCLIGVHLTHWLMGLAYGEAWYADFLLYHEPTFRELWDFLPEGQRLPSIKGWTPPQGWVILSAAYRPSTIAIDKANAYLSALQAFRRRLSHYDIERSTLYRTVSGERIFVHLRIEDIERHVATLRS